MLDIRGGTVLLFRRPEAEPIEIVNQHTEQRILVVDDDQAIRNLLCAVLERRGLDVDFAENGAEGLVRLAERPYAIILLDLMMPLVDGHQFLERLRDMKLEPRPVVLVISASDESDFRKLERGSVSAIIRKPFDIFELADLVGACIGSSSDRSRGDSEATPAPARSFYPRLPISTESRPAAAPRGRDLPDPPGTPSIVPSKKT